MTFLCHKKPHSIDDQTIIQTSSAVVMYPNATILLMLAHTIAPNCYTTTTSLIFLRRQIFFRCRRTPGLLSLSRLRYEEENSSTQWIIMLSFFLLFFLHLRVKSSSYEWKKLATMNGKKSFFCEFLGDRNWFTLFCVCVRVFVWWMSKFR